MNRPSLPTFTANAVKADSGLRIEFRENGLLDHDIVMGANTPQPGRYGIWGRESGTKRLVVGDMHLSHAYVLIGQPGSGKSLCSQVLLEMAIQTNPRLWHGERPMAAAAFHYAKDESYNAEFQALLLPNTDPSLLSILTDFYRADPLAHRDVVMFAPSIMVAKRQKTYAPFGVTVLPFLFSMDELDADNLKLLIGAYGDNKGAIDRMNLLVWNECERQGTDAPKITLSELETWMMDSKLSTEIKDQISMRISIARKFIHEGPTLRSYMKPGRLLLFDMRCKAITAELRFALGVIAMQSVAEAKCEDGSPMSKFVLFDEAHNVMKPEAKGIMDVITDKTRTRRHQYLSIAIATQDPMGMDPIQLELSDHIQIFRSKTPTWLGKLSDHCIPFKGINPYDVQELDVGECFLYADKSSEKDFTSKPMKMRVRPTATLPGGTTLTDTGTAIGH